MVTNTTIASVVAAIIAVAIAAAYISGAADPIIDRIAKLYFKGKAKAEEKALETMGENKASYYFKGQLQENKISDDKKVNEIQSGLAEGVGGGLNNPLGKEAGNVGDQLFRG
ncbi:MAG: hypothetical protein M1819_002845 [Sarea resinae]|nr:MAG: hypothetical protein M1819_002845 [Sarea resinae]